MACDDLPEAAELTRVEEAIVDILTQYYLENLEYTKEAKPPLLKGAGGETLVSSHGLRKSKKGEEGFGLRIVKPHAYHEDGIHNYSDAASAADSLSQNRKGYGTIYYLMSAIKAARENKTLYSQNRGSVSDSALKVWRKFENLKLVELIESDDTLGYKGRYRFVDFGAFNLEALDSLATAQAEKIKAEGNIQDAIAEIKERLRRPNAGEVL